MKDTHNTITDDGGLTGCPAATNKTPSPVLHTEDEMREVLGDHICDMPSPGSDEVESKLSKTKIPKKSSVEEQAELEETWAKEELEELERLGVFELTAEYAGTFKCNIEDSLEYGIDPAFFKNIYAVEKDDADNDKKIDGLNWKDKNDIIYKKALSSSITSTSVRLPDFYMNNIIDNVMRSEHCPNKTMAWVQSTSCGLTQTMLDLFSPECRSRKINRDIMSYLQMCLPLIKGAPTQNNINSTFASVGKVRVDRLNNETTQLDPIFILKIVKAIIEDAVHINSVTQTECVRLLIDNTIIGSKKRFGQYAKETAENDRELILDAVNTSAKCFAHETMSMYKMYKQFLGEQNILYIERRIKRIDMIFDTPHCKYCYSNNTKLRDRKRNMYKCSDCGRRFTPKSKN